MGLENVMKEISSELERLVSAKTVIGEPVEAGGTTIIPVTKVSFGFGSGGGEGSKGEKESGFGGGGGAGAKIEPVAFIVISGEEVRMMNLSGKSELGILLDSLPEVFEKIKSAKEKFKNKEAEEGSGKGDRGIDSKEAEGSE